MRQVTENRLTVNAGSTLYVPDGYVYSVEPLPGGEYSITDGLGTALTGITVKSGSPQDYPVRSTEDNRISIACTLGSIKVVLEGEPMTEDTLTALLDTELA